ncbi:UDP-N-acetylmuramoyl-L-alanyl-D-glutamate--2,6-diaminopimelate ligase [Simiduia litorea]|uniref:UDP-N-acetylmuramoyl-L-alanyl-D-glutamate--2, 6-diaminopimelate ligase n=1 Tax=Simiduia litorea TaxID=1435348 RepID=UPI0036F2A1AB
MSAFLQALPLKILLPEIQLPEAAAELVISSVTLDSRTASAGSLFFAVQGSQANGQAFVAQAFAAGALVALVDVDTEIVTCEFDQGWIIAVPNLATKVSEIAARFYGLPGQELKIIGVTGTNGKTTCSQLLGRLYHALGERVAVLGTLGYGPIGSSLTDTGMTTPDAVQTQKILRDLRQRHVRHLAMEVSSHALVQHRVAAVPMQTAVFTNLTRDHLDFHGDMENYGAAKLSLFRQLGIVRGVINLDDPFAVIIQQHITNIPLITYGIENKAADVVATEVNFHDAGIQALISTPWGKGELRSHLLGEFNLSNLLAVVATACSEGFTLVEVLAAVATLEPVPGRMQRIDMKSDVQVIVDYAHTPDALRAVLSAARLHCKARLWSVFGCGGDRDSGKRAEMAKISAALADCSVVTSDNPRTEDPQTIIVDIVTGFKPSDTYSVVEDRKNAIGQAVSQAQDGDVIVIAGKGHEDYQIIGTTKYPFSDIAIARSALEQRVGGGA